MAGYVVVGTVSLTVGLIGPLVSEALALEAAVSPGQKQ